MYEPIKRIIGNGETKNLPLWKNFVAGAIAGLIGSSIANPADVIKTRMQGQPAGTSQTFVWHIKDVYHNQGGVSGFYIGLKATCIRAMILNATKLGTYDKIKNKLIDSGTIKDGRPCQFVASVFAGFAMTCTTTAMDNIKTRLMNNPDKYDGIMDAAKKMKAEGGYRMFVRGFGP